MAWERKIRAGVSPSPRPSPAGRGERGDAVRWDAPGLLQPRVNRRGGGVTGISVARLLEA